MLFRIIDAIRRKPKHVREQYAFGGAVIFTAVVVGVWSLSLPARFAVVSEGVSEAKPPAAPFAHLIGQVKEGFSRFKTVSQEVKETVLEATSTEPIMALPEATATTTLYDIPTTTESTPLARTIMIGTSSASTTTD